MRKARIWVSRDKGGREQAIFWAKEPGYIKGHGWILKDEEEFHEERLAGMLIVKPGECREFTLQPVKARRGK